MYAPSASGRVVSDQMPVPLATTVGSATPFSSTVTVLPGSTVPEIVGVESLDRPPLGTVPVPSGMLSTTPVITGAAGGVRSMVIV